MQSVRPFLVFSLIDRVYTILISNLSVDSFLGLRCFEMPSPAPYINDSYLDPVGFAILVVAFTDTMIIQSPSH